MAYLFYLFLVCFVGKFSVRIFGFQVPKHQTAASERGARGQFTVK